MVKTQTALITGATSGIGLELATLFAEQGYRLVIVGRNKQRLSEATSHLIASGAKSVLEISSDLSIPDSPRKIYDDLKQRGIRVNVLVNDAGAGEYGPFMETSLEEELAIIQLNIASLVHLTKLFLKDMVQRNEGRILQLASIASYQPTPFLAVYAATKAFVLSFTDALINELKDSNVTMTALIPGATDTDFFIRAHAENTRAALNPEHPATVARIGFEALMKGEPHALAPGMRAQIIKSSLMTNRKIAAIARKQMEAVPVNGYYEDEIQEAVKQHKGIVSNR